MGSPKDVTELVSRMGRGERVKFLIFWGHQAERDGRVGKGCLSQWWPAPFAVDGVTFGTAEHYMMWRKEMLFGDEASAAEIVRAAHPRQAKVLGRGVRGFDQHEWDRCRFEIVVAGSVAKFGQHPELCRFLLNTGERVLVEASPVDPVWGIGLAADDPRAGEPTQWRGLNLLGFALTQARALLSEPPAGP